MTKAAILLVDDSSLVRRIVTRMIEPEPDLEVIGFASNGRLALERMSQRLPDLVLLDVEMPEMDGLETLREIRARGWKVPVLMFSTLTERGASATLDALARGASDYLPKPSALGADGAQATEATRTALLEKIRALLPLRVRPATSPPIQLRRASYARPEVLAIAASTGGPNALLSIFSSIGGDFPIPIALALHMPPVFTKSFAERLASVSGLDFREGVAGGELARGRGWIAPGGYHMTVERSGVQPKVALNQNPPENSCRPSADVLFRSVARVFGPRALALVLTGMGQDGLAGAREMSGQGAEILVQDRETSVVWSMPRVVAEAGLASEELALSRIAEALRKRACR